MPPALGCNPPLPMVQEKARMAVRVQEGGTGYRVQQAQEAAIRAQQAQRGSRQQAAGSTCLLTRRHHPRRRLISSSRRAQRTTCCARRPRAIAARVLGLGTAAEITITAWHMQRIIGGCDSSKSARSGDSSRDHDHGLAYAVIIGGCGSSGREEALTVYVCTSWIILLYSVTHH